MRRTTIAAWCAALMTLTAVAPAPASVSGRVVVGFGEQYASAGETAVHRGVDLAWDPGSDVPAPIDGEVAFAGRIPASAGGSVLAVTIRHGDDAVTVSPLVGLGVGRGDRVSAGDPVGELAGHGDASSAVPHVHVSLRRSGVYLDPMPLIGVAVFGLGSDPGQATVTSPDDETAQTPSSHPAADEAPASAPAASVVEVPAPSVSPAPHPAGEGAASSSAANQGAVGGGAGVDPVVPADVSTALSPVLAPAGSRTIQGVRAVAGGVGPLGVARAARPGAAPTLLSRIGSVMGVGLATAASPGAHGGEGAGSARRGADARPGGRPELRVAPHERVAAVGETAGQGVVPTIARVSRQLASIAASAAKRAWSPLGLGVLAAVGLAVSYLVSRRAFERRITSNQPVSDRFGSMLQHLRAGDTLCGLTSCSGLLPSQSRGRLAQRR